MKGVGFSLEVAMLEQLKKALEREEHPLVRQIIRDKIEELEKVVVSLGGGSKRPQARGNA